jgi:hypothetical protein
MDVHLAFIIPGVAAKWWIGSAGFISCGNHKDQNQIGRREASAAVTSVSHFRTALSLAPN